VDYDTKLKQLIADIKRDPAIEPKLNLQTRLFDDLRFDSLEVTELIFRLEDELGCQIDLETLDLAALASIESLLALVRDSGQKTPVENLGPRRSDPA
jgi:acyl carrier protein